MELTEAAWPQTETHSNPPPRRISSSTTVVTDGSSHNNNGYLKMKTQLCRRFRYGVCFHGSRCNYAHDIGELRRRHVAFSFHHQSHQQLCRMFLRNKHCTYGHTCRFLHSTTTTTTTTCSEVGKFDGYSSAECRIMQNSTAATIDGYSSAEYKIMQTTISATNASTSKVATSTLHKNEPYGVKCKFKKNELQKISGIYADWI